jgi:hypothetical protein
MTIQNSRTGSAAASFAPVVPVLPVPPVVTDQEIEAARYAVLRRLSPCLRHNLVRPLQPIGLIYAVMNHKLSAGEPDLDELRSQADKINNFAKAALAECLDLGSWLSPEPGTLTELGSGVRECVGLSATMLHFCGFRLENQVDEMPVQVRHDSLRMVLLAALLELTDSLTEQATIKISAVPGTEQVAVCLEVGQKIDGPVESYDDSYRKVVWRDVQALAASEDVDLSREDGRVTMRFPTKSPSLAIGAKSESLVAG